MRVHANAKLGPAGRLALVLLIESGCSLRTAAAQSAVSVATAHRWWHRWRAATAAERRSGAWAADRSSRPVRMPRLLDAEEQRRICRAREQTNLGPGRLAGLLGRSRSTIWKVLARHGLSRRRRGERQTFKRYEWAQPGALLHMDVKRLARFDRPGHWASGGQRSEQIRSRHAGWAYLCTSLSMTTRAISTPSSTSARTPRPTPAASSAPWSTSTDSGCKRRRR
jgi:transposase